MPISYVTISQSFLEYKVTKSLHLDPFKLTKAYFDVRLCFVLILVSFMSLLQ